MRQKIHLLIIAIFLSCNFIFGEPYPVYFADVLTEGKIKYLHFEWRSDYNTYEKVQVKDSIGNILFELNYPENIKDITQLNGYNFVYLIAVNKTGETSVPVKVELNSDYAYLYAKKTQEQIIVKKETIKNASFIEAQSGKEFIAKGVNFCGIRLGDHDTFEPDMIANQAHIDQVNILNNTPDFILRPLVIGQNIKFYDKYSVETIMRTIKAHGYNLVRVFIKTGGRGSSTTNVRGMSGPAETNGIFAPYMDNLVDFLTCAQKYGIYVMPCFTENEMLDNNYFKILSEGASGQGIFFSSAGILAKQRYLELFLTYIKNKNPQLINSIFALTMQNEFAFHSYEAPFSQISGIYTFLDGTTYDMTNNDSRRALANAAIRNYYSKMKQIVQSQAPGMLIGEGTFAMGAVGKNYDNSKGIRPILGNSDLRFPMTAVELLNTDIDFLDFHIYRWGVSGTGRDVFNYFSENMKVFTPECVNLMKNKPVIMGEFGSFKVDELTSSEASTFMNELQQAALNYGFKGSAYWTLNTFEQKRLWNLMWDNAKIMTGFKHSDDFGPFSQDVVLTFNITPTDNWSDFYIKPPIDHVNYATGHFQTRLLFGSGTVAIFNAAYQSGLEATNFTYNTDGTKYNFRITLYTSTQPAKITVEAKQDGATNWIVLFDKMEQAWGSVPFGTFENTPGYLQITNFSATTKLSTLLPTHKPNQIKLSPIPILNTINISAPANINYIKIYSILGALLKTFSTLATNNTSLNVDEFKSGIYFLQLDTSCGNEVVKFIKN